MPCDPTKQGHQRFLTFILHPWEMEIPSKTGTMDNFVPLDLPEHEWLAEVWTIVREWYSYALNCRVFNFEYRSYLEEFKTAAVCVGAEDLHPTPHSLRHGGASWDVASRQRSLLGVQRRGM